MNVHLDDNQRDQLINSLESLSTADLSGIAYTALRLISEREPRCVWDEVAQQNAINWLDMFEVMLYAHEELRIHIESLTKTRKRRAK